MVCFGRSSSPCLVPYFLSFPPFNPNPIILFCIIPTLNICNFRFDSDLNQPKSPWEKVNTTQPTISFFFSFPFVAVHASVSGIKLCMSDFWRWRWLFETNSLWRGIGCFVLFNHKTQSCRYEQQRGLLRTAIWLSQSNFLYFPNYILSYLNWYLQVN